MNWPDPQNQPLRITEQCVQIVNVSIQITADDKHVVAA